MPGETKKRCRSTQTRTGNPCRQSIQPCPKHSPDGKPRAHRSIRKEKLIEGILKSKSTAQAGREAGYSQATINGELYRIVDAPDIKDRIQKHREAAQIDTDEIVGTLVAQMRGDLADILPDCEVLKAAKLNGMSHLIRKVKVKKRSYYDIESERDITETETELELYSAQDAARQLIKVFGLDGIQPPQKNLITKFRDSVERIERRARQAGIEFTREKLIEKLAPAFGISVAEGLSMASPAKADAK